MKLESPIVPHAALKRNSFKLSDFAAEKIIAEEAVIDTTKQRDENQTATQVPKVIKI